MCYAVQVHGGSGDVKGSKLGGKNNSRNSKTVKRGPVLAVFIAAMGELTSNKSHASEEN